MLLSYLSSIKLLFLNQCWSGTLIWAFPYKWTLWLCSTPMMTFPCRWWCHRSCVPGKGSCAHSNMSNKQNGSVFHRFRNTLGAVFINLSFKLQICWDSLLPPESEDAVIYAQLSSDSTPHFLSLVMNAALTRSNKIESSVTHCTCFRVYWWIGEAIFIICAPRKKKKSELDYSNKNGN